MQFTGAILPFTPKEVLVIKIDQETLDDEDALKEQMQTLTKRFADKFVMLMGKDDYGRPLYFGNRQVADILIDKDDEKFPWKTYES